MIKALSALAVMLVANAAFADATVHAMIYKGHEYKLTRHHPPNKSIGKIFFPETAYQIHGVVIDTLMLSNYDVKNKPLIFANNNHAATSGLLTLESYDQETGRYKFKLTIKPIAIIDTKINYETLPVNIRGNATFNINNQPFLYVEGIANIHASKLTLSNINTNRDNSSFKLSVDKDNNNVLILTPLNDIQVMFNIQG